MENGYPEHCDDAAVWMVEESPNPAVVTFRDLIVWQKSMDLVIEVYGASKIFPPAEQYGLTSQLRRCAVSIPSNIAEGYGRRATGDYRRFLQVAMGSLYELQTHVELARRLGFLSRDDHDDLFAHSREIERMLSSLIRRLQ